MTYKEMQSLLFLYICRSCGGHGFHHLTQCINCNGLGIDKEMHRYYPLEMTIIEIEEFDRGRGNK